MTSHLDFLRWATLLLAVSILGLVPTFASADVGASDATSDTSAPDVVEMDAGSDAGDIEMVDVADTAVPDDTDAGGSTDVEQADAVTPEPDADAGRQGARFSGRVTVQSSRGDAGVTLTLTRTDEGTTREQTTGEDGRFAFENLPLGSYEVEVSLEGYVTIAESFELVGDRVERYTLYKEQNVQLRVRAFFTHVDQPPQTVDFLLRSDRGEFAPDEPIGVEEEVAKWTVEEVGVGNWTVVAMAEGFEDLSYQFSVTGPEEGQPDRVDIRLFMTPTDVDPPPPDTGGCSCDGAETGGGRIPGPTSPTPAARPLLLLLLSFWGSRRLISHYSSSRD